MCLCVCGSYKVIMSYALLYFLLPNSNMSWRTFHIRTCGTQFLICCVVLHSIDNTTTFRVTPQIWLFASFGVIETLQGRRSSMGSEWFSGGNAGVRCYVFLIFSRNSQAAPQSIHINVSFPTPTEEDSFPKGVPTASGSSLVCVPESDSLSAGQAPATNSLQDPGLVTSPPVALASSPPGYFVMRTKIR